MEHTMDEEIKLRGYKPNPEIIYPTSELCSMLDSFDTLDITKVKKEVNQMTFVDSMYDAKKFLNYYYHLHKIPYIKYFNVAGIVIQIVRNVSPYKLPIVGIGQDDIFCGGTIEEINYDNNNQPIILFRGLELFKEVTEQTSATYVHELTHTQLDRLRGSIRNYYNSEIISIFNELFHSSILDSDERLLRLNDARRIYEMKKIAQENADSYTGKLNLSRDTLLENSKYLVSDLKAYNLFITFYYGSDSLKNDILDCIQSVFDGYMTVEELLDKYDITFESSQDEQKLLRYFNR